jgi:hypothetical protein
MARHPTVMRLDGALASLRTVTFTLDTATGDVRRRVRLRLQRGCKRRRPAGWATGAALRSCAKRIPKRRIKPHTERRARTRDHNREPAPEPAICTRKLPFSEFKAHLATERDSDIARYPRLRET